MIASIDLGRSFSRIAYMGEGNRPTIILDSYYKNIEKTPNSIAVLESSVLVGVAAKIKKQQQQNTIIVKLFDRSERHNEEEAFLIALMLKKLKNDFEFTNSKLTQTIIILPTQLRSYIEAVKKAIILANFDLIEIIDEAMAAAYHYGFHEHNQEAKLLSYQLGGNSFSCTLFSFKDKELHIISSESDNEIGGIFFDKIIENKIKKAILQERPSFDWSISNSITLQKVASSIKEKLSKPLGEIIRQDVLIGDWFKTMFFERAWFEDKIKEAIAKTIQHCLVCIEKTSLSVKDIDAVLCVGGAANIPLVKKIIHENLGFDKEKIKLIDADKASCYGAIKRANWLREHRILKNTLSIPNDVKGLTGFNIGVKIVISSQEEHPIETLIARNKPIPSKALQPIYVPKISTEQVFLQILKFENDIDKSIEIGRINLEIEGESSAYRLDVSLQYTEKSWVEVSVYDVQTGMEKQDTFAVQSEEVLSLILQKQKLQNMVVNRIY